jgi:hypothetical protein
MFKHLRIIPFLIGLVLGFIGIYLMKPLDKTIMKYPSPENVKNTVYRDQNGICYTYSVEKVDCDKNEGTLSEYPIQ